jgi:hypothetical protein
MRTLLFILLAVFLSTSSFAAKEIDLNHRNTIQSTQQDSSKKKISLLKRLANAFKFRANSHAREKIRVIRIIDTLIKDSVLLSGKGFTKDQLSLKDSVESRLASFYEILRKIQSDYEKNKPVIIPECHECPSENKTPDPQKEAADQEKLNNDKYIDGLIKAILGTEKNQPPSTPDTKPERLALIRKLAQQSHIFKDTLNKKFERERMVKLKQAAEVWGFHPYNSGEIDLNYRVFSTIVIDAFVLNGSNGRSMNDLDLKNFEVSRRAKVMGSRLIMGITSDNVNTNTFLQSSFAQTQFTSKIISILAQNNMEGLNIKFSGVNNKLSVHLLNFISALSRECKKNNRNFILSLTIPAFDITRGYNLAALAPFTDRFLIDFREKLPGGPGPLAPLKQQSDYSIETCVSRYLNAYNLLPSKLIILLPYYGIKWDFDKKGKGKNPISLSYNKIRARYQFAPISYDEQTASAIIEVSDTTGKVNEKIWFDNEYTLGKKFDFALSEGLAGVAIWDLTADIGYGELADELAYKFLVPDTITTRVTDLSLQNQKFGWEYIIRNLKTYYFVLGHPCDTAHNYVDRTLLSYINIILIVICAGLAIFCFSRLRTRGDEWPAKKTMFIITGLMTFTLITFGFAWIFLDPNIPWFGLDKECIDMPFLVLYLIILTGIGLGILLMWLLLFPIVRQEDTP